MGIYARHNDEWYRVDEGGSADSSSSMAWGDFTTNGEETESGTYGPDAQGRMWKWSQYSTRKPNAETYSINLSGGMYRILTASGGAWGNYNGGSAKNSGGDVNDGIRELPSGTYQIQVGKRFIWGDPSVSQMPLTQTTIVNSNGNGFGSIQTRMSYDNNQETGSASPFRDDLDNNVFARFNGQHSDITGVVKEYGAIKESNHTNPSGIPMGFGNYAQDGGFIIATVTNDESEWNQPGALPGIGGWATITDVKGKGTKYSYGDWVAFEWTGNGSVTTTEGLADHIVVGGGGFGSSTQAGLAGLMKHGLYDLSLGVNSITVGIAGTDNNTTESILGPIRTGNYGGLLTRGASNTGLRSEITGTEVMYGHQWGPVSSVGPGSPGMSGASGRPAQPGVVIVRVPKANYTGNLPDGAFDVPTTRQAVVTALEEKVEAVKDTMIIDGRETKIKRNRKR